MKKSLIAKTNNVLKKVRSALFRWGYNEILLQTIANWKPEMRRGLKFVNCGKLYLIRPDATSQILYSLNANGRTERIFYVSEVLDGKIKGEFQLGIEVMNASKPETEILFVIISVLEEIGIKDFYIDIGSLNVWRRAIRDENRWKTVLEALRKRDFEIIENAGFDKKTNEKLWNLFNYRGKISDYEKLNEIVGEVGDERVFIDFGTMRPLTYYWDLVFEIYSPRSGKPIGGGGDYLTKNGKTGVGVGLNLSVITSLANTEENTPRRKISASNLKKAYETVKSGRAVFIDE